MKKKKLYIVRHGQSYANIDPIIGGADPELTEKGKHQAKKRRETFKDVHFVASYSSQLIRAQQTAAIILQDRNIPHTVIPNFHERDYGNYFEHPNFQKWNQEIQALLKTSTDEFWWDYIHTEATMIESNRASFTRFMAGLSHIINQHTEGNILIVSHGNLMVDLLVHLGFGSFLELEYLEGVENTGYIVLEVEQEKYKIEKTHGIHKRSII